MADPAHLEFVPALGFDARLKLCQDLVTKFCEDGRDRFGGAPMVLTEQRDQFPRRSIHMQHASGEENTIIPESGNGGAGWSAGLP